MRIVTSDDPSEGIPGSLVEPVVEGIEALFGEKLCRAIVEIRIKLMDDALEA